jgi:NADP-dependent 3-hydroxy acid dehydrogenase YdfG
MTAHDPVLDLFRLDGRTAVVTGASTGLGVEFARTLARAGARLVLVARRADLLELVRDGLAADGHEALAIIGDVADPATADFTVTEAMQRFGRIDVLINNAGIASSVPATRETPEQFRSILNVNLEGAYWMAQACGRAMQPGSSIVNVSSILALKPARLPHAAYAAAQGNPGERDRARILQHGDQLRLRSVLCGAVAVADAHPPLRAGRGAVRRDAVARLRRRRLHDRHHRGGRRRTPVALTTFTVGRPEPVALF